MNGDEKETVLLLMYVISQEGPFTALGFFSIELNTLTSIISTTVTYLVILVQFQESDAPKSLMNCTEIQAIS